MADSEGHPDVDEMELSAILHAMSDANRRSVITRLAGEEPGTEQFCSEFGLPWAPSTRTHHFRVLRTAGLIRQRDVGNGRMTSLRRDDVDKAFPGLLASLIAADRVRK